MKTENQSEVNVWGRNNRLLTFASVVSTFVVVVVTIVLYLNSQNDNPPTLSFGGNGVQGMIEGGSQGFLQYQDRDKNTYRTFTSAYREDNEDAKKYELKAGINHVIVTQDITVGDLRKCIDPAADRVFFAQWDADEGNFMVYPEGPFQETVTVDTDYEYKEGSGLIIISKAKADTYCVTDPAKKSGVDMVAPMDEDVSGWVLLQSNEDNVEKFIAPFKNRVQKVWKMTDMNKFEKVDSGDYDEDLEDYYMVWLKLKEGKNGEVVDDEGSEKERYIEAVVESSCVVFQADDMNDDSLSEVVEDIFIKHGFPGSDEDAMMEITDKYQDDIDVRDAVRNELKNCGLVDDLAAHVNADKSVTLTWKSSPAEVDGADFDHYVYQVRGEGELWTNVEIVEIDADSADSADFAERDGSVSFKLDDLSEGTHVVRIGAVYGDDDDTDAENSVAVEFEIPAGEGDRVWPSDVENFLAEAQNGAVKLTWAAATDDVGVAGYKVYYGTTSVQEVGDRYDSHVDVHNVLTFTVPHLVNGTKYYFSVIAYDAAGNESGNWAHEVSSTPIEEIDPAVAAVRDAVPQPVNIDYREATKDLLVTWGALEDVAGVRTVDGYSVRYKVCDPVHPDICNTTTSRAIDNYVIANPEAGKLYKVSVASRVVERGGLELMYSQEATFTVPAAVVQGGDNGDQIDSVGGYSVTKLIVVSLPEDASSLSKIRSTILHNTGLSDQQISTCLQSLPCFIDSNNSDASEKIIDIVKSNGGVVDYSVSVKITDVAGVNQVRFINLIREIMGLNLSDARDLVQGEMPIVVKENCPLTEAEVFVDRFEELGVLVEIY